MYQEFNIKHQENQLKNQLKNQVKNEGIDKYDIKIF